MTAKERAELHRILDEILNAPSSAARSFLIGFLQDFVNNKGKPSKPEKKITKTAAASERRKKLEKPGKTMGLANLKNDERKKGGAR